MSKESVNFDVHPEIIRQYIWNQHGARYKAIIELIQNSIDAGADLIEVNINKTSFSVKDNGKGFGSKENILENFKTFGRPHTEGDGAIFGRFRAGRGQIFSHAHVQWRSGLYEMDVNLKTKDAGLMFDLIEHDKEQPGCVVNGQWHKRLEDYQYHELISTIKLHCKYLTYNIHINKESLLNDIHNAQIVLDDEELTIYYFEDRRSVSYYNLGVFVSQEYSDVSYDVVSKKQFELNTARNEILTGCQLKSKAEYYIKADRKKRLGQRIRDKAKTSEEKKQALENLLEYYKEMDFEDIIQLAMMPIIKESDGNYLSIEDMSNADVISFTYNSDQASYVQAVLEVNQAQSARLKTIKKSKTFAIIDAERIKSLHVNNGRFNNIFYDTKNLGQTFLNEIQKVCEYVRNQIKHDEREINWHVKEVGMNLFTRTIKVIDFEVLREPLISASEMIQDKDLAKEALIILNAIRNACSLTGLTDRTIMAGKSTKSHAWTNGSTTICINVKLLDERLTRENFDTYLNQMNENNYYFFLAFLILHEQTHKSSSIETLEHGDEFYKEFHDAVLINPKPYTSEEVLRCKPNYAMLPISAVNFAHKVKRRIKHELLSESLKKTLANREAFSIYNSKVDLKKIKLFVDHYQNQQADYVVRQLSDKRIMELGSFDFFDYHPLRFSDKEMAIIHEGLKLTEQEMLEQNTFLHELFREHFAIIMPKKKVSDLIQWKEKTRYGDPYRTFYLSSSKDFWENISIKFLRNVLSKRQDRMAGVLWEMLEIANYNGNEVPPGRVRLPVML
jgi:hypothetical protein